MDCSMSGFPVHDHVPELAQVHILWVGDAIQPSHPLPPSSPFAFSLSQHQGLFQWVRSLHQVAKVLELQLQHQSFKRIFRVDFLYDCCPRDSSSSKSTNWDGAGVLPATGREGKSILSPRTDLYLWPRRSRLGTFIWHLRMAPIRTKQNALKYQVKGEIRIAL